MTEAVTLALIALASSVVTLVMQIINNRVVVKSAQVIQVLEKNTNSIKDALVASTAAASRAEGKVEGIAQQKAEQATRAEGIAEALQR